MTGQQLREILAATIHSTINMRGRGLRQELKINGYTLGIIHLNGTFEPHESAMDAIAKDEGEEQC